MSTEIEPTENKALSKEEGVEMIEMFRYLLDAYALFATKLGTIQRDHKDAFDVMMSPSSLMKIPEMLGKVAEKSPELNSLLTKIFLKTAMFLPQIGNLMNLTAMDKIKLGTNLKSLAKDMDELLVWINKANIK